MQLSSLDELCRLSNLVVASGLAPQGDTPQAVAVKMQLGLELGLTPMSSLKNIAVINGRPGIFGDAGKALLLGSGLQDGPPRVVWSGTAGEDDWTCDVWLKRKGMGEFHGSFSVAQAKRAKLWGKTSSTGKPTPWVTHPDRQIEWRAWWYAAREGFADVLGGISAGEELLDIEPEPPKDVPVEVKPKGLDGLVGPAERAEFAQVIDGANGKLVMPAAGSPEELACVEHHRARLEAGCDPATLEGEAARDRDAFVLWQRREGERQAAETRTRMKRPPKAKEPPPEPVSPILGTPPTAPAESLATIHTWHPTRESVLEVAFPVACGFWDDWADEEVPKGGAFHKMCAAKGAPTWRTAAMGSRMGARAAKLAEIVGKASMLDGSTPEKQRVLAHERAACTLAILRASAKTDPDPAQEPGLFA